MFLCCHEIWPRTSDLGKPSCFGSGSDAECERSSSAPCRFQLLFTWRWMVIIGPCTISLYVANRFIRCRMKAFRSVSSSHWSGSADPQPRGSYPGRGAARFPVHAVDSAGLVMAVLAVAGLFVLAVSATAGPLRAGAARVDLTPPLNMHAARRIRSKDEPAGNGRARPCLGEGVSREGRRARYAVVTADVFGAPRVQARSCQCAGCGSLARRQSSASAQPQSYEY